MKKYISLAILIFLMIACASEDASSGWQELSLMEHGIPVKIKAPEGVEIKKMDFGTMKDVTVQKGDDYYIQIYSADATTREVAKVKEQQLSLLKENPYFARVVSEDDSGFIYENKVDSTNLNYGFRYIEVKGDKEYIYQTGLIGSFTEEQVLKMYDAVKK